jgi:hypothetical protein
VLRDPVALEHFKPLYSDRLLESVLGACPSKA